MDKDLEFLKKCDNDDLVVLVDYLTKDKKGNSRVTEALTGSDNYKRYYPHSVASFSEDIAHELCLFGGNTFANIFRGGGPSYRSVLIKVAKKMGTNFNKKSSVEVIEANLLQKIFERMLENMDEADLIKLRQELGDNTPTQGLGKQVLIASILLALRKGGFATYQYAVIIANAVARALLGRGLTFAANATLTRYLSIFTGPIGWILAIIWTAVDIAGPAYRVIVPSVIHVAYMRAKLNRTTVP